LPHPSAADLEALARRVAEPHGLVVASVEVLTHRIPMTVQVIVRRHDGVDVTLEQCAGLSGPLGEALEASALLPMAYVLEVSSPGIGDELGSDRDFVSFRGFPVAVLRREAGGGERRQEGLLLGRDDHAVQLNARGRTLRIPRDEIVRVLLVTPPGPA
jgi:ribosome maturation factor RimP